MSPWPNSTEELDATLNRYDNNNDIDNDNDNIFYYMYSDVDNQKKNQGNNQSVNHHVHAGMKGVNWLRQLEPAW